MSNENILYTNSCADIHTHKHTQLHTLFVHTESYKYFLKKKHLTTTFCKSFLKIT